MRELLEARFLEADAMNERERRHRLDGIKLMLERGIRNGEIHDDVLTFIIPTERKIKVDELVEVLVNEGFKPVSYPHESIAKSISFIRDLNEAIIQ